MGIHARQLGGMHRHQQEAADPNELVVKVIWETKRFPEITQRSILNFSVFRKYNRGLSSYGYIFEVTLPGI
jgi:hypothetical protein